MRILSQVQSLYLTAPTILKWVGYCNTGHCWPKGTLSVPQPVKCLLAQQCTRGPEIGTRVSGSFKSSLCDLVKSSTLSRLQFSQKQNGDNKNLPPGAMRGWTAKRFVKSVLSPRWWCAGLVCPSVTGKVMCRHFLSVRKPSFSINPHGLAHLGTSDVVWFGDSKFMDHKPSSLHRPEFFWVRGVL